ncbi:hypothetical protein ABFT23_17385 [Nocardioides sp. C4-1]|uniref:hypothetical protein n=1 Tax=Nocardioides sp. C4-1 TaxID=3151851 RepID=UPI0032660F77
MMRLLGVELTRLRCRRAVLVLLVAMLALPVVIGVITLVDQEPLGPDAYEQAEVLAAEEARQPYVQQGIDDCVRYADEYGITGPDAEVLEQCTSMNTPTADQFVDYDPLDLATARDDGGLAVAVVLGMLAMLVGATFAGHDWNTGSMSNQLLFEPRRGRVWTAKALAVVLGTGTVALVASTVFWLMLAARFWVDDIAIPDGVLLDSLQQGWRGAGVAAAGALGGYAITMLSRSTVFTIGLLFGVAVAGAILLGLLVDDRGPVDPAINAQAVIQDGTDYFVPVPESCYTEMSAEPRPECVEQRRRSLNGGLLHLGLLTVVATGASVVSFRRRDVP